MSHAPSDALRRRHHQIRAAFGADSLAALVVTSLPNVTYLTNFTGSSAIVVLTDDRLYFLTDSRYATAISDTRDAPWACPDLDLVVVPGSYDVALAAVLAEHAAGRVGFEAAHLSVSRFTRLASALDRGAGGLVLVATEQIVEQARVVKDPYEVGVLREAGRRLSEAAALVLGDVRAGLRERDVGCAIDARIGAAGFSRTAFDTIVASGPNAALPHARPTERILSEGDLVVLDFGGVYDSYCVDLTRTVAIGRASSRSRQVYEAVRTAHDRAVQAVAPGESRFAIDAAARDWLTALGMGDAFGHGTGHGLGIEVHEDPRIAKRRPDADASRETVAAGMVFTIEPGAYFPRWGGVRIEDDVLVTETGVELLTHVTTELLEID
jgi:Xaa-Pro aminopeptidase